MVQKTSQAMLKLFFSENRLPAYCFGLILLFYSSPKVWRPNMLNSSNNTQKSDCTRNMVCHYCAIKKLNGTVQTTKEMKILLKRGLWSHKTGHISNTIYDRKLKFGTQVKDFITYMTTIQSSLSHEMVAILHFLTSEIYIFQHILPISQPFSSILVSKCLVWSQLLNYDTCKLNGSHFDTQLPPFWFKMTSILGFFFVWKTHLQSNLAIINKKPISTKLVSKCLSQNMLLI